MTAGSINTCLSRQKLSSESRAPETEALLLRSVLEWPRDERWVFLRERLNTLAVVRDMLALLIAVTNPKDDPEEDFLRRSEPVNELRLSKSMEYGGGSLSQPHVSWRRMALFCSVRIHL